VTYEITDVTNLDATSKGEIVTASNLTAVGEVVNGATFTVTGTTDAAMTGSDTFEGRALFSDAANTFATLQIGAKYTIATLGDLTTAAKTAIKNASDFTDNSQIVVGATFTASANVADFDTGKTFTGKMLTATSTLTSDIEAVQAKINTARVQAGSQYAAIESAVNYTTDLTAQYELGFNAVSDVNFSMETAHLAKNQILQQAATAMLAQANQGQQGLLQLIQG
jgi:flagellin